MGNVPGRPLLELPGNALKNVLSIMTPNDFLLFSLCSRRAQRCAMLVNFKFRIDVSIHSRVHIIVWLGNNITVMIYLNPENPENQFPLENLDRIPEVRITSRDNIRQAVPIDIPNPGLSMRGWILHILHVYNSSRISYLHLRNEAQRFNNATLLETFKGINIRKLCFNELSMNFCYRYVSYVFLQATELEFSNTPHATLEFLPKITIQSLELVTLPSDFFFKLEDLLIIRIPAIELPFCACSDKTLNRFLKLWISGCNQELERLYCKFGGRRIINVNAIFDGVNYRQMAENEQRKKTVREFNGPRELTVRNARIVQRKDMREATIVMKTGANMLNELHLIVWS